MESDANLVSRRGFDETIIIGEFSLSLPGTREITV